MVFRAWIPRLERTVPWVALVAAVAGLSLVFREQQAAVAALDWTIPWRAAIASAFAFSLAPLLQGVSFWAALRMLTGTTPLGDALLVWSRSYVVRYAPTGAVAIAYRVASRERLHASAEQVLAAYGYEHVATLAAGAAACVALFAIAGDIPPLPALVVALGALALTAAVHPRAAGRALATIGGKFGVRVSPIIGAPQLAALVALNVVGWLGTGTAVYVLVSAVTGDAPGFVWLVGSYTAGYLVGFVTPLAPGGLGVREGMLVVLLRARYGFAAASGISIAIRIVNVFGELIAVTVVHCAYGLALVWRRRWKVLRLASAGAP